MTDARPVDRDLDRVSVVGVRRLGNQLGHAVEQRVGTGLPVAGGTDSWLIVRLANDVDSDVSEALHVFSPVGVTGALDVLGWGFGFVSEQTLESPM